MDIGNTLSTAFRITWQHKKLWLIALLPWLVQLVFGFVLLAVLVGTGMLSLLISFGQEMMRGSVEPAQMGEKIMAALGSVFVALFCVSLLLSVISVVVQLVTTGGLINGVWQAQTQQRVDVGEAIRAGFRSAGRLFGASFLLFLPFIVLYLCGFGALVAAAIPASLANTDGQSAGNGLGALACIFPLALCGSLLYGLVAAMINTMAGPAIVLNKEGAIQGLSSGWRLVRQNLGNILLMGLLLGVVAMVLFFGLGLVSQITMQPMMSQMQNSMRGASADDPQLLPNLLSTLFGPVFLVTTLVSQLISFVIYTGLSVFSSAAFTLAYGQFEHKLALLPGGDPPTLPPPTGPSLPMS